MYTCLLMKMVTLVERLCSICNMIRSKIIEHEYMHNNCYNRSLFSYRHCTIKYCFGPHITNYYYHNSCFCDILLLSCYLFRHVMLFQLAQWFKHQARSLRVRALIPTGSDTLSLWWLMLDIALSSVVPLYVRKQSNTCRVKRLVLVNPETLGKWTDRHDLT